MSFIQAKAPATHDFYRQVHKGLRLALSGLLTRLGACGADDAEGLKTLLADLRFQMEVSEHHLANEDRYIHTALEERAPGSAAHLCDGLGISPAHEPRGGRIPSYARD